MKLAFINNKIAQIAIFFAALPFLWLGAFGLIFHSGGMKTAMATNGCLFDGGHEVCAMDVSEHVSVWQGMFTGLPQTIDLTTLMLLALAFVVGVTLVKKLFSGPAELAIDRAKLYFKSHERLPFFYYLKEIFSAGILNSKIYASVAI